MLPSDRRKILDELEWHFDAMEVGQAFKLLTPAEAKDILKRGFLSMNIRTELQRRLAGLSVDGV